MKKALIYAAAASVAAIGFVMFFVVLAGLVPTLAARIDYETLGSMIGYILIFGIIPAASVIGFDQQLKDEERQRDMPVHECENLRPLHLAGLPDTLKAIAASRR